MSLPAYAIGIDIGGTKTSVGLVDGTGTILARRLLATEAPLGFPRAVRRYGDAIVDLLAEVGAGDAELGGIGIGCAGPVDPARGLINNPYTLEGWLRCDILTPLRERFDVPVVLENDADAAGLGECWTGAGRGFDQVVMLTFGTGIGGAILRDGHIVRGAGGEHPELGHLPVLPDGPPCYCGTRGCLESFASGTALNAAAGRLGLTSARELFRAADRGHEAARETVGAAVRATGIALWAICHSILPQRIVLGGGIMESEYPRFQPAFDALSAATQFTPSAVTLARASLGNDAGMVGAARLALAADQAGGSTRGPA